MTTNCSQLKMMAPDGKMCVRDVLDTEGIFRLIESVPSPKAEPFKLWLAKLAKDSLEEKLGASVISNKNNLPYEYKEEKLLNNRTKR